MLIIKTRKAELLQVCQKGRITSTKSQSERKKGASLRGNCTTSLLLISSCAMEVAIHKEKEKAAIVRSKNSHRNKNSQTCVLHCTTDRGQHFCLSRQLPLQQVSNTLLAGDLQKMLMHQQDPCGMKQYSLQRFSK